VDNLIKDHGTGPIEGFRRAYPTLRSTRYRTESLDLDRELDGSDLVIVHEWNEHALVKQIGELRRRGARWRLLFHDTHHRSVTDTAGMAGYDLTGYDGVLAFGSVIRDLYLERGWAARAWTWHEAADTRVFRPLHAEPAAGDVVWIGNWGDDERSAELREFLLEPVKDLRLRARVHGVRYPQHAIAELTDAGIEYAGWLPNYEAPRVFASFRATVHVPRRPYATLLPGIPTIRVFEALACGIPLISAPWEDSEGLFTPGRDFLIARNGGEMKAHLQHVLGDASLAASLAGNGRRTVLARHTCAHRVDELMNVCQELGIRSGLEAVHV
jgi:spore maturation protein CgeB